MIGCFYSLRDEDLEAVIQKPLRFYNLCGLPQPVRKVSLLERLLGSKSPKKIELDPWIPSEKPEGFDVDKAWDGIHFLLAGKDADEKDPLAFVLLGGREIEQDTGYGNPHGFTSSEVKEIAEALNKLDIDKIYKDADPAVFAENGIYPEVWKDEPKEECIGYVTDYLKDLREFVSKTAQANRAMVVYLG